MRQSLILGGSQYGGLGIQLRDGSTLYIWITDQMGGHALKAAKRIAAAMKAAGVPEEKEPRVIHALVPPTFEAPGEKKSSRGARFLMALALLPFVGIGVMVGLTEFPRTWRTIQTLLKPDAMSRNAKSAIPAWVHPSLEWYSDLGLEKGGNSHRGGVLCATRDGGAVLTVQNMIGRDVGFLVVRTDGRGDPLWQTSCGTEQWDYAETILETHDGGCLVVGGARPEIGLSGMTRASLVRLKPSGQMYWDILLGGGEVNDWGDSAVQRPDGGCVAAGLSKGTVCIFHLDEKGALVSKRRFRGGRLGTRRGRWGMGRVYVYGINVQRDVTRLYPADRPDTETPFNPGRLSALSDERHAFEYIAGPPFGMDLVKVFASTLPLPVPEVSSREQTRSYEGSLRKVGANRRESQKLLAAGGVIHSRDLVDYYRGVAARKGTRIYEDQVILETRAKGKGSDSKND